MRMPDEDEFTFTFSRSSGSGGQNVNKVNTAATLEWDLKNSPSVAGPVKERFKRLHSRFVRDDGVVTIQSQEHRSQKRNREECKQKLHKLLEAAFKTPKKRKPTKPTKSSVKKRLESKKKHGEKKSSRRASKVSF